MFAQQGNTLAGNPSLFSCRYGQAKRSCDDGKMPANGYRINVAM